MADTKLSALTELTATPANDDEVYIRDVSEEANAESKKITTANLLGGVTSTTTFNDHSARHENGGADEINVAGLSGELADNQPPKTHASTHTNGTDDIQDATSTQKGLATATQIAKLGTIEESADVTDSTNVNSAGAVMESDYNANTILMATTDNTPTAITVAEQTVVGRITSGAIKALSVAELQTLILSAALPENVSITLDAALSADGKYCGVTETGTAGTALSFGHVVYFSSSDNKWEKAKGDAESTVKGKVGICVKAAVENASTIILLWGKVRADAIFPTLTVGSPVFISWETAGLLTQGTPTTGKIMRCIGHPNSGDELYVCPDNVYVEAA